MKQLTSLFLCTLLATAASAAEHHVSSAADVARLGAALEPGDTLVMSDGVWKDQPIVFRGRGQSGSPITLRASTPGKVTLAGSSSLTIDGEHLVVSGLRFRGAAATGDGVTIKGGRCRLTESAIVDCDYKFYVHLFGEDNYVDRCYLAGKTSNHPTVQVEVERANRHKIVFNHFGHRPPLGRNGGETIRVGYSHQATRSSGTLVAHNLFDRCDGELEIISSKSCDNVYESNTFLECAGTLTLRHGDHCRVEGNFFLGRGKRGSGGVRVIGHGHEVLNNYMEGLDQGGFWITAGIPDSPAVGYVQASDCTIAFNTFVESKGPAVVLDAGFGTSGRTLRPQRITLAGNLFMPSDGTLLRGTQGEGFTWVDNVAWWVDAAKAQLPEGVRAIDPKLARASDGLLRPGSDSPLRAAARRLHLVESDVDGQSRPGPTFAGCDEFSDARVTRRPLTAADVGPSWMADDRPRGVPRTDRNSQVAHEQLLAKARKGGIDVYFVGDSITRRWGTSDPQYKEFLANWRKNFYGWNAANFGWGGDTVHNVLWRLENGELDGVTPKVIVLMAGTNDVGNNLPADKEDAKVGEVVAGTEAVLEVMKSKAPDAAIVLMAITPRNDGPGGTRTSTTINRINERIATFADGKTVRYLNINDRLADRDGKLFEGVTVDGLHLSAKGYQLWADALRPLLTEVLGPPAKTDHAPEPTGDPGVRSR